MTTEELLAELPGFVDPEGARGMDAVVDLVVDEDRFQFVLRETVLVVTRDGAEAAALTVRVSEEDLHAVAAGRAHPVKLFAAGRLRASGDLFLAYRLRRAFVIPPGYG
jgi:putative sterol carrier protein